MSPHCIVVDANIVFKTLCAGRSDLRERIGPPGNLTFYCPRFLFVELFKHKERLVRASHLDENELLDLLHTLVSQLDFVNETSVPIGIWMEAYRLCREVDEKDTPYVALALHFGSPLWTDDNELKTGLRVKGFDQFYEPPK